MCDSRFTVIVYFIPKGISSQIKGHNVRNSSKRKPLLFATAVLVSALAFPTAASASPPCSSGYICLFNETEGSDDVRVAHQYGLSNYAGSTYYNSKISLDNSVEAVHYNWNSSSVSFWTQKSYEGTKITTYKPGQQGFRNWTAANCNIASSHKDLGQL